MGVFQWLNEHWYMYILIALAVVSAIASLVLAAVLKREVEIDNAAAAQKRQQRRQQQQRQPKQGVAKAANEYEDPTYLLKQAQKRGEPIVPGYGQLPATRPGSEHLLQDYSLAPPPYGQLPERRQVIYEVLPPQREYDKVPPEPPYDRVPPEQVIYEKLPDVVLDPRQYQAHQNRALQQRIVKGTSKQ